MSRAHRVATLDRRKLQHWELIPPEQEAQFLFHFALRNGNVEEIRTLIAVSESEKQNLDFLVHEGVFAHDEIQAALDFRAKVLSVFERLTASAAEKS